MKSFPKKYKPIELSKRSKLYRKDKRENDINNIIFSPNTLTSSKKLSSRDFFPIYIRDFFNQKNYLKNKDNGGKYYEQLYIINQNQLENLSSSYQFFNKKNQSLLQVWVEKLERHILSHSKKYLNANNKILECYSSSNHKIYMPDSDLYIYILEQFHSLRNKWKIKNETKIGYRSFNLQTSIPKEKISRREEKKPYYILKYFIWAKCEALPIYVEDIDSCCWDVALLVHPKDKRYNKHIWKKAIIPLCNRQIPIIWYEKVNIAQNNWIKRVCPCCDEESIALAKEFWLPTDIYVFDRQWLYTEYIHESAFVWGKRSKYYDNIVWFIEDIWNLSSKWEKLIKVPYLKDTDECLVPYKLDELTLDIKEEKEIIIDKIINNEITFSFLNINSKEFIKNDDNSQEDNQENDEVDENWEENYTETNENDEEIEDSLENEKFDLKTKQRQKITEEINSILPDYIVCNSQIPYWWRIPLKKDEDWSLKFFDIENECTKRKEKGLQFYFNFILLCLIRAWSIWKKSFSNQDEEYKLCEYDKFPIIIAENEKKIQYLMQYSLQVIWSKNEYEKFLQIISNITDENNSSLKDFLKLVDNCKYIKQDWKWLILDIKWIINETIDSDFIQLFIPCYLKNKGININNQIIYTKDERTLVLKELILQQLLFWEIISNEYIEQSYNKEKEFLWEKLLTKLQIEQSQRDIFSLYGENPIRLSLLTNKTIDHKEIILNNILLKQIWNATRLCIQKDLLPKDIKKCLDNPPKKLDDFDLCVLEKLNELYNDRIEIKKYKQYIKFFNNFKESIQNIFFSRYLEIQKINPTKDAQFVCSYFFNLILTILYPSIPEFVDALQYVSERNFTNPISPLKLTEVTDYNMNILYNAFINLKRAKIECNIRQHEPCNIFIKSTPTIWEIFSKNEQIFKNYFHIEDINYLRLHETNPLSYEIFNDSLLIIWIQPCEPKNTKEKNSLEYLEKTLKDLDDKLIILRQRIQILPEWEQRTKTEEEYAKTKEEIENITIKYSLLSNKQ